MFSIIIPLFNKESTIVLTLESIKKQSYLDYEVIIIDDGSTDKSKIVVNNWLSNLEDEVRNKFKLLIRSNHGVSSTRNHGIFNAKYDYIAFLDADDYWLENHLEDLKQLINNYAGDVDVFSTYCIQEVNKKFVYPKLKKYDHFVGVLDYFQVSLISNGFINSSSICVKKNVLLDNLFPQNMSNFEDMITWAKCTGNRGFAFISNPSSVFVIDNSQASLKVDFFNYIKYSELLKSIYFKKKIRYKVKFFLLHILFAKNNMPSKEYYLQSKLIIGKDIIISFCLIVGFLIPKSFLKKVANIRKEK